MKKMILLLAGLTALNASAQQDSSTKIRQHRFQIGVSFSPDLCYRTLRNSDGSASSRQIIDARNKVEAPIFGTTTGINLLYDVSKLFSLELGTYYASRGYRATIDNVNFTNPNPGSPTKTKMFYRYGYLDIPIKANFTFGNGKLKVISGIAVATSILVFQKEYFILQFDNYDGGKQNTTIINGYNKVNICPTISAGVKYYLSERFTVKTEPTFRYSITKMVDAPIAQSLWCTGLNVGFYARL